MFPYMHAMYPHQAHPLYRFPSWNNFNHSVIKKNEMMSFAGKWLELKIIMLSEISQTVQRTL
jgi:hypothetical protein